MVRAKIFILDKYSCTCMYYVLQLKDKMEDSVQSCWYQEWFMTGEVLESYADRNFMLRIQVLTVIILFALRIAIYTGLCVVKITRD